MSSNFFKFKTRKLNLDFLDNKLKRFSPNISGNLEKDKKKFTKYWKESKDFINKLKSKNNKHKDLKKSIKDLYFCNQITKKIFLNQYSSKIYKLLTNDLKNFIRVENLVYEVNKFIPFLTPTKEDVLKENNLSLKNKDGIEIDQGIFLSSILSNKNEGNHLCESMLKPSKLALLNKEVFEKEGFVDFKGATIQTHDNHNLLTLENKDFLNAEDENTLYPLEAAIDLAILEKNNLICVLRGTKVKHKKYKNQRIFGSGINLTHLYEGKISFLWYIVREMGAVHKVFRGISEKNQKESALFPNNEKIWIGAVDNFAIGGGCQYLLVMDHIIADKKSYMTLPARKEGIIPGAANLRLWRFVGDRTARQAIQNGLTIKADSEKGKLICDEVVSNKDIDKALNRTINAYCNSGVVGAAFNRRALRLGQESIDNFREYMSLYCHDQAYCHFSKELINNLEKFWLKS